MLSLAHRFHLASPCPPHGISASARRWLGAGLAVLVLSVAGIAAEPAAGDFGKDIQLAPFVVKGKSLAVSIRARTRSDRRYGEKFSDEVIQVAYETLNDTTGKGLVIVGEDGEPHPIILFRKFIALAAAGQLDPGVAASAGELGAMLKKVQDKMKIDEDPKKPTGITFETFLPALPLRLEGAASKLYQLAWAEGFEDAKVEKMLKSLTPAGLTRGDLTRYDWVFYLPPHGTTSVVLKEVMDKGMKSEKWDFEPAAIKSALLVFRPVVNKAVEGMRKGMMFRAILEAESKWNEGDLDALSKAYMQELMPDLKPGSGDEHARALAAIGKQKIANAEYAKDPFVKPERLATFEPAAYAACEGEYGSNPAKPGLRFKREGDSFQWNRPDEPPRVFFAAGERLLVNEKGTVTIRFLVDEKTGAVTGVEERWLRNRRTIPRQAGVPATAVASAK